MQVPVRQTCLLDRAGYRGVVRDRVGLANQAGKLGKRIVCRIPSGRIVVVTHQRIAAAVSAEIVIGHGFRLAAGVYAILILSPLRARTRYVPGGNQCGLTHLAWRLDPEQSEPRREHSDDALHEHETRHSQFSIILDNEA